MSPLATAWLQGLGLFLDIIGVLLLFKFGIPPRNRGDYQTVLVLDDPDPASEQKEQFFDRMGTIGLLALLAGFILQLTPNIPAIYGSLFGK